jgi:hypothetical protein
MVAIFAAVLFLVIPRSASAHDIPNDGMVLAFVKPSGERLNVLVRVPLNAMRDTEFPERGPGYLDLDRLEPSLREAATEILLGVSREFGKSREWLLTGEDPKSNREER